MNDATNAVRIRERWLAYWIESGAGSSGYSILFYRRSDVGAEDRVTGWRRRTLSSTVSQPALQIQLGGNRPLQLRPTRGNMLGKSIFRTVQFNQIAQLKPWVAFM